jgi:acetyl-CoA carboxylase carboxyltransferase component
VKAKTPADGKVAGFGRINGREVALVSNDFTVLGASSAVINMKKIKHVKQIAAKRGMPLVMLGESSGARMPDRMGSAGRAIIAQDAPSISGCARARGARRCSDSATAHRHGIQRCRTSW